MTVFNKDESTKKEKGTLGSRIAKKRKELELTQEEFSARLGVTAQAVSKWENDVSCPDIMLLPKISEVLEISIDELMGVKPKVNESDTDIPKVEAERVEPSYERVKANYDNSKLKLRINITDNRNKVTKIALPLPFVLRVADLGVKISSVFGTSAINDLQLAQILEIVKSGVQGEIFDLTADDGTKVKIEIS